MAFGDLTIPGLSLFPPLQGVENVGAVNGGTKSGGTRPGGEATGSVSYLPNYNQYDNKLLSGTDGTQSTYTPQHGWDDSAGGILNFRC